MIGNVPELRIARINVTSDARPTRGDEKQVNALCVRA